YKPKDRQEEMFKRSARSAPDGILYGVSLSVETRSGRGRVKFTAVADAEGFLAFAGSPASAPGVHFDGPLRMGLQPWQELLRGDKPTELHVWLGTPGLGTGAFAVVEYASKAGFIPDTCHPVAEIEFPGQGVRTKAVLGSRC